MEKRYEVFRNALCWAQSRENQEMDHGIHREAEKRAELRGSARGIPCVRTGESGGHRSSARKLETMTQLACFLGLQDFDDYMSHYESLCGMKMDVRTFRKEQELMGTDNTHTHREKESILEKKRHSHLN